MTSGQREAIVDARASLADTVDAVRRQAETVGERMPEVIEAVRSTAVDGARTLQAWPEDRQRPVAAFSLGLGLGLALTGAPRLAVLASAVPAALVVAALLDRERAARPAPSA
jgi:hypothetical protein